MVLNTTKDINTDILFAILPKTPNNIGTYTFTILISLGQLHCFFCNLFSLCGSFLFSVCRYLFCFILAVVSKLDAAVVGS